MKSIFKHTVAVIMVFAAMFLAMAFSSALADVKVEGSVAHTEATISEGSVSLTDTIDALHADATAGAKAGYDSRTGYGVNASASASASVGNVTSGFKWGGDETNMGAKVDISAGKAAANASAGVNYNDGKVTAGVRAGAELTAVDIGGNVTGSVCGVEGSVGGSLKLGSIGAGANFGIKDGKIDFGANLSLGIGGSFHVSLDVGSIANKVCGFFSSLF